jgi:hypothetical protein
MAVYRFPQFNVDLTDPTMEVVKATYQIGGETGSVSVVLSTASARLFGVTFDGFPNEGEWSDADVMAWAVLELEKYRVEIP